MSKFLDVQTGTFVCVSGDGGAEGDISRRYITEPICS